MTEMGKARNLKATKPQVKMFSSSTNSKKMTISHL